MNSLKRRGLDPDAVRDGALFRYPASDQSCANTREVPGYGRDSADFHGCAARTRRLRSRGSTKERVVRDKWTMPRLRWSCLQWSRAKQLEVQPAGHCGLPLERAGH